MKSIEIGMKTLLLPIMIIFEIIYYFKFLSFCIITLNLIVFVNLKNIIRMPSGTLSGSAIFICGTVECSTFMWNILCHKVTHLIFVIFSYKKFVPQKYQMSLICSGCFGMVPNYLSKNKSTRFSPHNFINFTS